MIFRKSKVPKKNVDNQPGAGPILHGVAKMEVTHYLRHDAYQTATSQRP